MTQTNHVSLYHMSLPWAVWKLKKHLREDHIPLICITDTPSMGRFVYLPIHEWLLFMVNVGKYTIHGSYGPLIIISRILVKLKITNGQKGSTEIVLNDRPKSPPSPNRVSERPRTLTSPGDFMSIGRPLAVLAVGA